MSPGAQAKWLLHFSVAGGGWDEGYMALVLKNKQTKPRNV